MTAETIPIDGAKLKAVLKLRSITSKLLAESLGISQVTVSRWINHNRVDTTLWKRACEYLQIDPVTMTDLNEPVTQAERNEAAMVMLKDYLDILKSKHGIDLEKDLLDEQERRRREADEQRDKEVYERWKDQFWASDQYKDFIKLDPTLIKNILLSQISKGNILLGKRHRMELMEHGQPSTAYWRFLWNYQHNPEFDKEPFDPEDRVKIEAILEIPEYKTIDSMRQLYIESQDKFPDWYEPFEHKALRVQLDRATRVDRIKVRQSQQRCIEVADRLEQILNNEWRIGIDRSVIRDWYHSLETAGTLTDGYPTRPQVIEFIAEYLITTGKRITPTYRANYDLKFGATQVIRGNCFSTDYQMKYDITRTGVEAMVETLVKEKINTDHPISDEPIQEIDAEDTQDHD